MLRFWEKGYRQRAVSPWGLWHIAGMRYMHGDSIICVIKCHTFSTLLRDSDGFRLTLLSTSLGRLFLSFGASTQVGRVLLQQKQVNYEVKPLRENSVPMYLSLINEELFIWLLEALWDTPWCQLSHTNSLDLFLAMYAFWKPWQRTVYCHDPDLFHPSLTLSEKWFSVITIKPSEWANFYI